MSEDEYNGLDKSGFPRIFTYFYKVNSVLLGLIGFFLFATMCTIVFGRYLFKIDLNAADEYLFFALIWSLFLGGAAGSYEQSHMRADTIATMVKNKTILKLNSFLEKILTVLISGAFVYFAALLIRNNLQLPSYTNVHRMPFLIGYSAVFYGGLLMFIYSCLHFYKYLRQSFFGKTQAEVTKADMQPQDEPRQGGES